MDELDVRQENARAEPAWRGNNCAEGVHNRAAKPATPRIAASSHKDARNPEDHDADDKLSW